MTQYGNWSVGTAHGDLIAAMTHAVEDYLSDYARVIEELNEEPSYSSNISSRRVVIVVLLASYLEAIINTYFAFRFSTEQLAALRRMSLIEKWTVGPSLITPGYTMDRGATLFADLKALIEMRNKIVHMQPEFRREGNLIHKGNAHNTYTTHDELVRWLRLPAALVKKLGEFDKTDDFRSFESVSDVWKLTKNWQLRYEAHLEEWQRMRASKNAERDDSKE